jgi:hypothetical protein
VLPLPPGAASLLKQGLGQLRGRRRPRGRWGRSRYLWSGGSRRDDLFGIFHGIIWRFPRGPQFIQVIPHFGGQMSIVMSCGGLNPPPFQEISHRIIAYPHKIIHHVRTTSTSGDMIWLFFLRAFWMVSPYCLEIHLYIGLQSNQFHELSFGLHQELPWWGIGPPKHKNSRWFQSPKIANRYSTNVWGFRL